MDDTRHLEKLPPVDRFRAASAAIDAHRHAMAACATLRAQAIRELQSGGANMSELAETLGITRQNLYRAMRQHLRADSDDE